MWQRRAPHLIRRGDSAFCQDSRLPLGGGEGFFAAAFGDIEHSYALTINDEKAPSQVLHPEIGRALISLLNTLPNNINTMSPFVTTLTESSQNLGFLKIDDQTITLEAMERSCVAYRAEEMLRASRLIAEAFGFTYT